jgi:hypothetical protein
MRKKRGNRAHLVQKKRVCYYMRGALLAVPYM